MNMDRNIAGGGVGGGGGLETNQNLTLYTQCAIGL